MKVQAPPGETARLAGHGALTATAEEVEKAVAVIESASPELARELRSRSPQDVNLAINFYLAFMATLQTPMMLYQIAHQQPPTEQHFTEIVNQTTNICNVVINMPPGHG